MNEIERYQQELKKQLGFLRRSCQSYDEGEVDEAIRIAVPIRTLMHDTRHSTSLLTHLNAKRIKLRSYIQGAPENAVWYTGMGQYRQWNYGNRSGASYGPIFDDSPHMILLPASEWWDQIVYVFSRRPEEDPTGEIEVLRLSRKDLVRTATDQDGGAHVDQEITNPAYKMLAADGAVGSFIRESGGVQQEFPITKAHPVALRQIGHEVLRSFGENWSPVEPVLQEFEHIDEDPPVDHMMQEFEPLGGDPPRATLFMRCGTLSGPESWRELDVEVTPIDTEIGVYSFTCPYCKGKIVWDPRELRPPAPQ